MSTITLPVSSPPLKPPRGSLCICRIKEELVYKTQLSPQWLLLTICFRCPVAITPWALCISPSLSKLLYPRVIYDIIFFLAGTQPTFPLFLSSFILSFGFQFRDAFLEIPAQLSIFLNFSPSQPGSQLRVCACLYGGRLQIRGSSLG